MELSAVGPVLSGDRDLERSQVVSTFCLDRHQSNIRLSGCSVVPFSRFGQPPCRWTSQGAFCALWGGADHNDLAVAGYPPRALSVSAEDFSATVTGARHC